MDINKMHGSHTPLMLAVQARDHKAVDLLLEYDGLRASLCNAYSQTALSMAITQGSVSIVQQLLCRGDVEFYSQDPKVQQPLLVALESRQHEIFEILLWDSRANINMKDNIGPTILHLAVIYDDLIAVARLAREELVDVDCPEHLGETPLMLAAKLHAGDQPNNVKILKCLLSRSKAMVDQRDQRGQSVLSHAVNTSNTDLIQCLGSLTSD
jgi:ankyrin repeat protein